MLDAENEVFTMAARALRPKFPGILVTSEVPDAPKKFPCVSVVEADNYPPKAYADSSGEERVVTLVFRVDAFSNAPSGRKEECKAMLDIVRDLLFSHNFRTFSRAQLKDMGDTICHMQETYRVNFNGTYFFKI